MMKKGLYGTIIALILATSFYSCNNNGIVTVKVEKAGTLAQQCSGQQWSLIKKLAIEGPLNEIDIAFLKTLDCNGLECLDLSKAENLNDIQFYFDSNLFSSVTLPDNVETIEDEAFQGCLNLKEIKVSPNNTHFKSVDGVLYSADESKIIVYPALLSKKSFTIPASVNQIGNCLFAAAYSLENIEVDKNNKSFCSYNGVLYNKDTTSLVSYPAGKKDVSFTLPNKVVNINWSAFWGARHLKEIKVESGNAFYTSTDGLLFEKNNAADNDNQTLSLVAFPPGKTAVSYKLPDGVTQLSTCAFKTCQIDTLILGKDVHFIDKWAFNGSGIKHFEVAKENISFTAESGLLFKGNSVYLCPPALCGDVYIKPTTTIDERAFQRSRLSSLRIDPTFVTGPFFCSYCSQLESVCFENGTKEANGLGAFFCCPRLKSADLPESFEKISNRMFFGCINLQKLIVRSPRVPEIDKYAFTGVDFDNCIVYVPANLINSYRENKDWNVFKNIKPLSDNE